MFVFPVCLEFGCVKEKRVVLGFLTVVIVLLQVDVADWSRLGIDGVLGW